MRGTLRAIILALVGVILLATIIKMAAWTVALFSEHVIPVELGPPDYARSPSPVRSPTGVVRAQIDACRYNQNSERNEGIATLYNFMSPSARSKIGTFSDFEGAFGQSEYASLTNHVRARFGPLRVESNKAQQVVQIVSSNRERVSFVFFVTLQESGPYTACWMTENILRYELR